MVCTEQREELSSQGCGGEAYPGYDVTAQVLQVGDDVAVRLYVGVLNELGEVLISNACKEQGAKQL